MFIGCGKTSLIQTLAGVAGVNLEVLNVHAGLTRADIADKVIEFILHHSQSTSQGDEALEEIVGSLPALQGDEIEESLGSLPDLSESSIDQTDVIHTCTICSARCGNREEYLVRHMEKKHPGVKYSFASSSSKSSSKDDRTDDKADENVVTDVQDRSDTRLWIFLDEINTCDELGFINSIICHRELPGFHIPENVSFFAACNPYTKVKKGKHLDIIGLSSPKKVGTTVVDDLVYRVNPLPETMLDFLWDFGSLAESDEERYIFSMIDKISDQLPRNSVKVLTDLIAKSQTFIRDIFGRSSVSMRDVRRVKTLVLWFIKTKETRPKLVFRRHVYTKMGFYSKTINEDVHVGWPSMALALAHCYRCRLADIDIRHAYDNCVAEIFHQHGGTIPLLRQFTSDWIRAEIEKEQLDYVQRMQLGEGIALNDSLLENVFVLLVCILNKMPVFLVGKIYMWF